MGHHSNWPEWLYIGVIVALMVWVGAEAWNVERLVEHVPADAETIIVTGQQWFWTFEHEDGTKEVGTLHVEAGKAYKFEVISSGGGNVHTLDSLAGISEKIHNIEKVKREMLQPYVMIGFMLLGITGFVTLMVIDSLTSIGIISENDENKKLALKEQFKERFTLLSMSILVQAYLAGLFLGKIISDTYSGGFRYSAILIIISMGAIALMQSGLFDIQALLGTA